MENGVCNPFRIPFGVMPKYMESLNLKFLTPIPQSFNYLCTQRIGISSQFASTFHRKIRILQKLTVIIKYILRSKVFIKQIGKKGGIWPNLRWDIVKPTHQMHLHIIILHKLCPERNESSNMNHKSAQKYHTSNRASESWSATKDNIWLRPPSTTLGKSIWATDILQ